jgi:hypothetical protein
VTSGVAGSVIAGDLETIDLEDLFVGKLHIGALDVVQFPSKNRNARESSLHLVVSLRVIVMMVSGENVGWGHRDVHRLEEGCHLCRLCHVNQHTWLRVQVSCHIVTEVVVQHGNDVNFDHIFYLFSLFVSNSL